jgi:SNF2 family DNA or RNA helicase
LNYIQPKTFASLSTFSKDFGKVSESEQVSKLQHMLSPYLLRRMKEDVAKKIPPKEETIIEVELTMLQKQYYRAVLERNRGFLNKGCVGTNVPKLINVVMQLRKVCNHPYLIEGVEDKATSGLHSDDKPGKLSYMPPIVIASISV